MADFTLTWLDLGAIATTIGFAGTALRQYVNGHVAELRHRLENERLRVDALEASNSLKLERLARLEAFMESMKEDNRDIKTKLDQLIGLFASKS